MAGRLVLAAALLVPVLIASVGARASWSALRWGRDRRARFRGHQRRPPVHAHRVGPGAHRLGDGGDCQRLDADLRRAAGMEGQAQREREGLEARRRAARVRRRWRARRGKPARRVVAGRGHARGRARGVQLRRGRSVRTAPHVERPGARLLDGAERGRALVLLPFGVAQLPSEVPGWKPIASVLALGIAATAIGTLLYYRLVALHGSARASLVVYLLPPFALVYGATLLDESLTAPKVIGLVLILGGVALGSGLFTWARRPAPVPE